MTNSNDKKSIQLSLDQLNTLKNKKRLLPHTRIYSTTNGRRGRGEI